MLLHVALLATLAAPQLSDPTLPPVNVRARFTVEGIGVQVYHCVQPDGAFTWEFQEPAATLFDPATHQQVGTHAAGPTWTWADGSAVIGKIVQKLPSPDPANIPWLLLQASPSGETTGALTGIVMVRRSNTAAGVPPASSVCDAHNLNVVLKVPYQATYTFYEPAK
jgi:hypothetical protein